MTWAKRILSHVRLRPFDTATEGGRSSERYRRILLTTLSGFAVRGVAAAIGLVTVPLVLGYLGKERFGLWSAITAVIAWASLLDFGIANGLVNLVSRAHGRDDEASARRYISTAFALLGAVAVAVAVLGAIALPLVPWARVLAVRDTLDPELVRLSVMAAAATFALGLPLSIVPQILSGYQRSYVFNAATLLGTVAGFAAVVLAIRAEASMPWMVAAFGVAPITAPLAAFLYTLARIPSARPALEAVSRHAGRALSGRSLPMFLFQIGALAVNETQVIVLAHRCDLAAVADYTVLMRLYIAAMGVIQLSTASFLPTFREAWERGDEPWMRSAFRRFLGARMALAVALAGTLAAVGDPLLRLWLRRTDVAFGGAVWGAAAIMMVASTWVASHSELLAIMDRLWVQVGLVSMNGAVAIGLTYVLAPRFSLLGVVLSTSAVSIAVFSWLLPRLANRLVLRPHPG